MTALTQACRDLIAAREAYRAKYPGDLVVMSDLWRRVMAAQADYDALATPERIAAMAEALERAGGALGYVQQFGGKGLDAVELESIANVQLAITAALSPEQQRASTPKSGETE